MESKRPFWFRVVAIGVPTLVGLATLVALAISNGMLEVHLAEGIVEFRDPAKFMRAHNYEESGHVLLHDETLGWRNPPNYIGRTYDKPLRINSQGLRDREYDFEKPDGTTRILVLGDSYTWGFDVANDDIYTEVLERTFGEEGKRVEVINAGANGWGTDQEYLFFRDEGVRYEPDIVVLAFYVLNDFNENTVSQQHGHNKPYFRDTALTLGGVPVPKSMEGVAQETTTAGAIEITVAIIEALQSECRKHDMDFVVMIFGTIFRPGDKLMLSYTDPFFEQLAQVPGLRYFNLDDRFKARGISRRQLTAGNAGAHWNAFGHNAAAQELHAYLREQALVAGP